MGVVSNSVKIMRVRSIVATLVVLGLLAPVSVAAATFIAGEKDVSTDGAVPDDLFIAGSGVVISDNVGQDVFAGGQSVTVESRVGGDVFAGGNFVLIKGIIDDDVLAGGEKVEIRAESVDDVFAAGNRVEIASDTVVNGSVFAAGQTVTIAGAVKGNVKVASGNVVIKSSAVIEGDLSTYGKKEPAVETGAVIRGNKEHKSKEAAPKIQAYIGQWVGSVVAWFVVGMVLLYVAPGFTRRVTATAIKHSGRSIIVGTGWVLLCLPAMILLMITVVGMPAAVIIGLLTALLMMLAVAYAMVTAGVWIMEKLAKSESGHVSWQHVLLGVVVYKTVRTIPIVGWPAVLVLILLALGALLWTNWQLLRGTGTAETKEAVV